MPQRPHIDTAGRAIVDALGRDKWGMAIGNLHFRSPKVKVVALLAPDGAAYLPTRTHVGSRAYPLSRSAYAYVNRPAGKPLDSEVASFLRFILSAKGQGIIDTGSGYLPLPQPAADKQLRKLGDRVPSQNGL
jgi:phosphate transport system substrate-binding protein